MTEDTQLLKGILEGCILAILSRETLYGYRVVERLNEEGFADIQESTVYPILNRLDKKGLIRFEKRPSDIGPPRKYYSLTAEGTQGLMSFRESWFGIRETVERIVKETMA